MNPQPITTGKVDALLQHYRPALDEIPKGEQFPDLNAVAKQCRTARAQTLALRSILINSGAEAVGFLLSRKTGANNE